MPSRREVLGLALAPLGLALVRVLLGRPVPAVALVALVWALANAVALEPALAKGFHRSLGAVASGAERGVGVLCAGIVFALLVVPGWAFGHLRRRSGGRPRSLRTRGWEVVPGAVAHRSGLHSSPPAASQPKHRLRSAFAAVGLVLTLLVADAAAGLAGERLVPRRTDGPVRQVDTTLRRPGSVVHPVHDPRADTAAMAGAPWREAYFAEFQSITYTYWPYLLNRPETHHGRYFNMEGWERRSWRAPGAAAGRPVVWFFGGSALWGEGQRDAHTISSEVARLAAADGLPIEARNYGQSGWVQWQEVTLFDELLGDDSVARPDLVVFYDGANDVSVQAQPLPGGSATADAAVPSHFGLANAIALSRPDVKQKESVVDPENPVEGLWRAYRAHSLAARLVSGASGLFAATPAYAQEVSDIDQDAVDKAVRVYRRGRSVARSIGQQADVPTRYFWQPEGFDLPGYRQAPGRVGAPTVDLTGVLDDEPDVFLDLVHTNEHGAHVVAQAMYQELKKDIVAWYEEHRGHD